MREPANLLARAYATLGLSPGCSQREAARQYKRLARRWHPDQYANDPQGQAEAAQRMREINRAFALLRKTERVDVRQRGAEPDTGAQAVPEPSPHSFGHRLSEADLREIADAIREPSMAAVLGRYLAWG